MVSATTGHPAATPARTPDGESSNTTHSPVGQGRAGQGRPGDGTCCDISGYAYLYGSCSMHDQGGQGGSKACLGAREAWHGAHSHGCCRKLLLNVQQYGLAPSPR